MDLLTDAFARVMSDVLLTGKDANLVVTCGDIIWKVQIKVLEGRSRYYQALLKTDAVTDVTHYKTYDLPYVDFSEYHPIMVDRLLEWIHTLSINQANFTSAPFIVRKIKSIHQDLSYPHKASLAGEDSMFVGLSSVALTQFEDSLEKEWDAEKFTGLLLELHPKPNGPRF